MFGADLPCNRQTLFFCPALKSARRHHPMMYCCITPYQQTVTPATYWLLHVINIKNHIRKQEVQFLQRVFSMLMLS